jgi:hypothetical protein
MTFRFPNNLYDCTIVDGIITIKLKGGNPTPTPTPTQPNSNILNTKQFSEELRNGKVIVDDDLYLNEFIFKGRTIYNGISCMNLYKVYIDHCLKIGKSPSRVRLFALEISKYIEKGRTTTKDRKCITFYIL